MVFGFKKIMDSAMDIDNLNLANLMGKVVDEIMEYQIFYLASLATNIFQIS